MRNPNKKGSAVKLWSVLTIIMVVLLIASIIGANMALSAAGTINAFLNTDTYKIVENRVKDTAYFKSGYASPEELEAAKQSIAEQIAGEGAVLLLNNGALPLAADSAPALKKALEETGFAAIDDAAIVTISRFDDEAKAMLEAVENYETVIVLTDATDLSFISDCDVDAALWMGEIDASAAADILVGSVNPSGRLSFGSNFGYGLSCTTFEWSNFRCVYNPGRDQFFTAVDVTNTGNMAGKEVVQVYFTGADTAELCGFAKTSLLEPGACETVIVTVPGEALAVNGVLHAGDYYLTAAPNAQAAMDCDAFTYKHTVEEADTEKYASSPAIYPFEADGMPIMGAENGLELAMFIGRAFDDPVWEKLLDQLTFEDMVLLTEQPAAAIPSVGKPAAIHQDISDIDAAVMATFNPELAEEMGKLLGEEYLAQGVSCLTGRNVADNFLAEAMGDAKIRGIRSKGVYLQEDLPAACGQDDPAALRQACHRILYAVANSSAMNGISPSAAIAPAIPWWQLALYGLMGLFGLGTVGCGTRLVLSMGDTQKKVK